MRTFRAQSHEDITPEDWRAIQAGEYLEDPHDGIMWDAGIARYNRHVTRDWEYERTSWKQYVKWFLLLLLFIVFAMAMYDAGIW